MAPLFIFSLAANHSKFVCRTGISREVVSVPWGGRHAREEVSIYIYA